MIHLTGRDLLKIIFFGPFFYIYHSIRSIFPKRLKRDLKLIIKLDDFFDELEYFVKFMGKGPIHYEKFRIKGNPLETHIEFNYLSNEFDKQSRLAFFINQGEDHFTFFRGGNSGGGASYWSINEVDFTAIAKEGYSNVEQSYVGNSGVNFDYLGNMRKWKKETINPILEKYNVKDEFNYLRYALISASHPDNHVRKINAKMWLVENFKDQEKAENFISEIHDNYLGKITYDKLAR